MHRWRRQGAGPADHAGGRSRRARAPRLRGVDYVVVFSDTTVERLLRAARAATCTAKAPTTRSTRARARGRRTPTAAARPSSAIPKDHRHARLCAIGGRAHEAPATLRPATDDHLCLASSSSGSARLATSSTPFPSRLRCAGVSGRADRLARQRQASRDSRSRARHRSAAGRQRSSGGSVRRRPVADRDDPRDASHAIRRRARSAGADQIRASSREAPARRGSSASRRSTLARAARAAVLYRVSRSRAAAEFTHPDETRHVVTINLGLLDAARHRRHAGRSFPISRPVRGRRCACATGDRRALRAAEPGRGVAEQALAARPAGGAGQRASRSARR